MYMRRWRRTAQRGMDEDGGTEMVKVKTKQARTRRKQNPNTVASSIDATFNNTSTTIRFRGSLIRFITADLDSSGMYLPFRVPVRGQCIPQTASNTRKEMKQVAVSVDTAGTSNEMAPIR